jgi:hypothetical protein
MSDHRALAQALEGAGVSPDKAQDIASGIFTGFMAASGAGRGGTTVDETDVLRAEFERSADHERELNKATATFERLGVWGVGLINAAALGVLIESTKEKTSQGSRTHETISTLLIPTISFWSAGIFVAGIAIACAYMCQMRFEQWARHSREAAKAKLDQKVMPQQVSLAEAAAVSAGKAELHSDKAKFWQLLARGTVVLSFVFFLVGVACLILQILWPDFSTSPVFSAWHIFTWPVFAWPWFSWPILTGPWTATLIVFAGLWLTAAATILKKAGYSGWWCLLLLVPLINVLACWFFAASRWPKLGKKPHTSTILAIQKRVRAEDKTLRQVIYQALNKGGIEVALDDLADHYTLGPLTFDPPPPPPPPPPKKT